MTPNTYAVNSWESVPRNGTWILCCLHGDKEDPRSLGFDVQLIKNDAAEVWIDCYGNEICEDDDLSSAIGWMSWPKEMT